MKTERTRIYIGPRRKKKGGGYYPKWPYRYKLPGKPWVHGTGAFTEAATRQLVDGLIRDQLQADQLGLSPAAQEPIAKHIKDYLHWGKTQGGKGGLPWVDDHYKHRVTQMAEWVEALGLRFLSDIHQDAFEAVNTRRLAEGMLRNTVNHHADALLGFLRWCKKRKRIAQVPLEYTKLDKRPVHERGAFTAEEFRAIYEVASPNRKLVYRVAAFTGYRRTALSKLQVLSVDWATGLIDLHWTHNKNRKSSAKPLPPGLLQELFVACAGKAPTDPLLDFSVKHAALNLHRDMKNAGVPLRDAQGRKRDFHSLKASLGTILDDLGTLPEVTQKALDHASFTQTQAYLKKTLGPMREALEGLEERLFPVDIFPTSEDAMKKSAPVLDEKAGGRGLSPSASAPRITGGNPGNIGRARIYRDSRLSPNSRGISPDTARKLFAHISHKLGQPGFAEALERFIALSPSEALRLVSPAPSRRRA